MAEQIKAASLQAFLLSNQPASWFTFLNFFLSYNRLLENWNNYFTLNKYIFINFFYFQI